MTTKSEDLFVATCTHRGYQTRKISPSNRRSPDYLVTAGIVELVAEVKQLDPGPADHKRFRELRTQGYTGGTLSPTRIRKAISEAADQLREYRHLGVPMLVVLYDNIVISGERPLIRNYLFQPMQLEWAMYGLHVVRLEISGSRVVSASDARGGGRNFQYEDREYVSAVSVMTDEDLETSLQVFHSFFAEYPLPGTVFSGANDHHYRNPSDPLQGIAGWVDA